MIFCSVNGLLHIRAKKLPKFTLAYGKLDSLEQSSVKFESKYNTFHWRKCIPKCRLQNSGHLVPASMCYSALFTTAWDAINRTNSAWSGDNFDYSVFVTSLVVMCWLNTSIQSYWDLSLYSLRRHHLIGIRIPIINTRRSSLTLGRLWQLLSLVSPPVTCVT